MRRRTGDRRVAPRGAGALRRARRRLRPLAARLYGLAGRAGRAALGPAEHRPGWDEPPWAPLPEGPGVLCNICRWQGARFEHPGHVERATCPACGSIARDRFLHWCLARRVPLHKGLRVIECSPRLGRPYRQAMSTWFFYRATDFEQRAHAGDLRLDLQDIDLPDGSVDVVLCSHVLEHVPDTARALANLRRVLAPGGHLLLQVPTLQAHTGAPARSEHHDNHTRVFWRFGLDLTMRLRDAGFGTALLCTEELAAAVRRGGNPWDEWSAEFDVPGLLAGLRTPGVAGALEVVAGRVESARLGLEPGYQFLTWDCRVPA